MTRIIRRTLAAWQNWRFRRKCKRFVRSIPQLNVLDHKEAEARRLHRPTRHIVEAKRRIVLEALRAGR